MTATARPIRRSRPSRSISARQVTDSMELAESNNWYAFLRLSPGAREDEIQSAVERLSRQASALAVTAPERSQSLRETVRAIKRDLLSGPENRRRYDAPRLQQRAAPASPMPAAGRQRQPPIRRPRTRWPRTRGHRRRKRLRQPRTRRPVRGPGPVSPGSCARAGRVPRAVREECPATSSVPGAARRSSPSGRKPRPSLSAYPGHVLSAAAARTR